MKTHELTIKGCITVPENVSADQFGDEFIAFIESKGYSFGGGIGPYQYELDENDDSAEQSATSSSHGDKETE